MIKIVEETTKSIVKISVRNLVEFILREGDIDNRRGQSGTADAMQEGTRIHRKIQKSMGESYQAEVPLKIILEDEEYDLVVEGRADGIIKEWNPDIGQWKVTIDEIKGIYQKLMFLDEPVMVHKAQAMCYAYIYAIQNQLDEIAVQMTYCNLDTEEKKYFHEDFTLNQLSKWFDSLIQSYKKWADFQFAWRKLRQDSIKHLEFPFEYRKGQKELVTGVYRTIARGKYLFLQAPTGVGKTISTVFPAVKAVGEGLSDRIFYLTAKTMTGTVALETFSLLRKRGYQAKIVAITAKEKLCLCEEMDCNPVHCPYAKGHYDRINDAVYQLLTTEDVFTREVLLEHAQHFRVCPFELCLDLSTWSDNIICDYNYVFDPTVSLKRFFADGIKGDYIFLVDEAHNLVERSREMYSACLYKEDFLEIKRLLKNQNPSLEKNLTKCNRIMLDYKRECENYEILEDVGNLILSLMRVTSGLDEFLQKHPEFPGRKKLTEFYFSLRNFLNIYELLDEHYVIYSQQEADGRFLLKLYCVDPSLNLQERLDKGNATIFFSATFLPVNYYKNLLSTRTDNYAVYAETAFGREQSLLLLGKDVSSRYTRRTQEEFERIARYITAMAQAKQGNYMVFFPSYKLMQQVQEAFLNLSGEDVDIITQQSGMRELEREQFLEEFSRERQKSLVAFCIMGGIFGEGIDLKQEQLIGAMIVGTGIPQISNEREILMNYYEKKSGSGFDYAYRYPGMNKVLQAAGRVIRTLEDVGVIVLLDERFLQRDYRELFPREWEERKTCTLSEVGGMLEDFWEKHP